mmetsp:Transcript_96551/g.258165  ORF Transcript_96551/g.258165 Transcript_96551/m.258165 type:complete len:221 (-) Transcript_96551:12-674(-)
MVRSMVQMEDDAAICGSAQTHAARQYLDHGSDRALAGCHVHSLRHQYSISPLESPRKRARHIRGHLAESQLVGLPLQDLRYPPKRVGLREEIPYGVLQHALGESCPLSRIWRLHKHGSTPVAQESQHRGRGPVLEHRHRQAWAPVLCCDPAGSHGDSSPSLEPNCLHQRQSRVHPPLPQHPRGRQPHQLLPPLGDQLQVGHGADRHHAQDDPRDIREVQG